MFELADPVPEPDPSSGGRPRQYPVFMCLLFEALGVGNDFAHLD